MDRYRVIDESSTVTRSSKNKELYTSLDNNVREATITDVRNANIVELNNKKNYRTREGYHQIKDYGNFVETPKVKKQLDDFNYLYRDHENKIYDINTVIEDAKKRRGQKDEIEERRKIKNEQYLLTKEEIEKYREEKKNETVPDSSKMKELINTITSKTLSGELDQETSVDLLSNLMATNAIDRVAKQKSETTTIANVGQDFLKKVQEEEENYQTPASGALKDIDDSFYTKSMDLSDKDFDMDDEFVEKKKGFVLVKVFFSLLLLVLVGVLIYFIVASF